MTGAEARATAVGAHVIDRLSGFAEHLRRLGVAVGAHELMQAMEVLTTLDLSENDSLYWALRLAMVRDSRQIEAFDRAFAEYWSSALPEQPPRGDAAARQSAGGMPADPSGEDAERGDDAPSEPALLGPSHGEDPGSSDDEEGDARKRAVYSDLEVLAHRNFADYTPADHRKLVELLARFQAGGPWRLSRRKRAHRRGPIDLRRTVRAGFRTEGYPLEQLHQRQQLKHRRLTFVCDVSGSMEQYSRAVLELAHVALVSRRRVEAFAFATRLTRLTRELLARDPDAAVTGAIEAVVDWSGGTRVGECLADLNRSHRAALQGAVVVIASDGWDLGDPETLAAEAEYLHRLAHRVIWVNPQLQDPAFEPLTRGMSAALPHVDDFISCHNFGSFLALIELLERL